MKALEIAIVITGSLPYWLLMFGIAKGSVKQSFSTWTLWSILDVVILYGITNQNGNALVYWVFTIGTSLVALFLLLKKQFSWGRFETLVTILVALCVAVLFIGNSYYAIIAGVAALNIAGIPQLIATWKDPKSTDAKAYFLLATSSFLSIFSSNLWTVQDKLPQVGSTIYCSVVALLALRMSPKIKNKYYFPLAAIIAVIGSFLIWNYLGIHCSRFLVFISIFALLVFLKGPDKEEISASEKWGEHKVSKSDVVWRLPRKMSNHGGPDSRTVLEENDFTILGIVDEMLYFVEPPKGWTEQGIGGYWSQIKDENGILRFNHFRKNDMMNPSDYRAFLYTEKEMS